MLNLAREVASCSKDPSTKVGAVIADAANRVLSLGFNGYPRGVADVNLDDREYKYERIVHAELNALLFARGSVAGATLYVWPMPPCARCAGPIIQAEIFRVVSPPPGDRWAASCFVGQQMLAQAGVRCDEHQ
jgi:dCMP deaminase